MALPVNRNVTFSPSDPIPSVLLNALQDSLIGFKHPELIEYYAAAAFAAFGTANLSGGFWTSSSANQFYCPLPYPVGCRITQMSAAYRVGVTAGASCQLFLRRRNYATPTVAPDIIATMAADTTDNAAGESSTVAAINHTIVAGYLYDLQFTVNTTGSILYGANVGRDRL